MGPKRGRLLIRQPRVKRDSDPFNPQSPEPDAGLESPSTFTQRLLTVPHPKIERHASEPAPNMTISSSHLLPVPQTPFLVKQHSHPLLLQSTDIPPAHFTLQRQLSYPTTTDNSILLPLTTSSPVLSPPTIQPASLSVSMSATSVTQYIERTLKIEDVRDDSMSTASKSRAVSPAIVVVSEPTLAVSHEQVASGVPIPGATLMPSIRVKGEELQRSISSPQVS